MLSLLLAFKNPAWAGWSYFLLAPVLSIHGSIYGTRVKRLAEREGLA